MEHPYGAEDNQQRPYADLRRLIHEERIHTRSHAASGQAHNVEFPQLTHHSNWRDLLETLSHDLQDHLFATSSSEHSHDLQIYKPVEGFVYNTPKSQTEGYHQQSKAAGTQQPAEALSNLESAASRLATLLTRCHVALTRIGQRNSRCEELPRIEALKNPTRYSRQWDLIEQKVAQLCKINYSTDNQGIINVKRNSYGSGLTADSFEALYTDVNNLVATFSFLQAQGVCTDYIGLFIRTPGRPNIAQYVQLPARIFELMSKAVLHVGHLLKEDWAQDVSGSLEATVGTLLFATLHLVQCLIDSLKLTPGMSWFCFVHPFAELKSILIMAIFRCTVMLLDWSTIGLDLDALDWSSLPGSKSRPI